jgi:hypothetical protein
MPRMSSNVDTVRDAISFVSACCALIKLLDDRIGHGGVTTDLVSVTMTKEQAALCVVALKSAIEL